MSANPNDNSKIKIIATAVVIGILVLSAAVVAIVYIVDGNRKKIIPPIAETEATATEGQNEVQAVSLSETETTTPKATAQPPKADLPPYGPFDSRQALINHIEEYYRSIENGYGYDRFIADRIDTDFGSPKHFSHSEWCREIAEHNSKHNIVSSNHDFNWKSLKATPQSNGGVVASYNSIYYLTTDKDGYYLTRKYRLTTTLTFNSKREITKIKESTKKLDEWYD